MDNINRGFRNWFGVENNSKPEILENMWSYGLLSTYYAITMTKYMSLNKDFVNAYRWESNLRHDKLLESWTLDKEVALNYSNKYDGHLIEKSISISRILINTDFFEDYDIDWFDVLGLIPEQELIVLV